MQVLIPDTSDVVVFCLDTRCTGKYHSDRERKGTQASLIGCPWIPRMSLVVPLTLQGGCPAEIERLVDITI